MVQWIQSVNIVLALSLVAEALASDPSRTVAIAIDSAVKTDLELRRQIQTSRDIIRFPLNGTKYDSYEYGDKVKPLAKNEDPPSAIATLSTLKNVKRSVHRNVLALLRYPFPGIQILIIFLAGEADSQELAEIQEEAMRIQIKVFAITMVKPTEDLTLLQNIVGTTRNHTFQFNSENYSDELERMKNLLEKDYVLARCDNDHFLEEVFDQCASCKMSGLCPSYDSPSCKRFCPYAHRSRITIPGKRPDSRPEIDHVAFYLSVFIPIGVTVVFIFLLSMLIYFKWKWIRDVIGNLKERLRNTEDTANRAEERLRNTEDTANRADTWAETFRLMFQRFFYTRPNTQQNVRGETETLCGEHDGP